MDYAPRAGFVPLMPASAPRAQANLLEVWDEARTLAAQFWARVREDERLSRAFRRSERARA